MQLAHNISYFQLLRCRIVCEYSVQLLNLFGSKSSVIIDFVFRMKIKRDRLFSDLHFYIINSTIYRNPLKYVFIWTNMNIIKEFSAQELVCFVSTVSYTHLSLISTGEANL